jgi:hypothetical protein
MVIEINNAAGMRESLQRMEHSRRKRQSNLAEYFGMLPNIGDGLEYQKTARNEWN